MLPLALFAGTAAAELPGEKLTAPANAPNVLGAITNDLVYTPIAPCRIVNTQLSAAGTIAAGSTRSFRAINTSFFAVQGGSATNCGTLGLAATGVMLHVTAVTPALAGSAIVYAFGTTQPTTTTVQYSAGAIVSSAVLAQIPNPQAASDFTIFTSATAHFTVDIVGYFAPPVATALDCTTVSGSQTVAAGAYVSLPTLFCPASYTPLGLSISANDNVLIADSYTQGNAGQVFVRSLSANGQTVTAKLMCCRVPGR